MRKKRKIYTPAEKAKIAIEAIKGELFFIGVQYCPTEHVICKIFLQLGLSAVKVLGVN